ACILLIIAIEFLMVCHLGLCTKALSPQLAYNGRGLPIYRQSVIRLPGKLFKSLIKSKCLMLVHQPV
ncbi:MAG TPA: hypothetical protein VNR87_15170, partial [Flavisolibacter sp.]|nr:hypothetical protein [Flavisolibacter sp.]